MAKINEAINNLEIAEYNNRKVVLSTKQGTPLRIQFPRLYMPFGVSGFTPEVGPTKYNIDFALKGHDEDDSYIKSFYEGIRGIEDKIIESVVNQSEKIFGSHMSKEDLIPMFNSNVKQSPDREPKFRVKVDTDHQDMIKAGVYDSDKNAVKTEVTNGLYSCYRRAE